MLPLLFVSASRQKPHQVQQALYPSAITGGPVTACRCPLNRTFALRLSRLNRFSNASPKPSSICACTSLSVSELLHKVNLYHSLCRRSMTSTASQPASKKSSGDFPVVRCTHVLSSSMSFPYGKIVTHFRWFVNGEFRYCITLKMSTLNSTFFHVFIVLPFCTIRNLFYCIFSLLGSAIVRLPLLPASLAPYFRSYASCFTSSSNSSPAE